MTPRLLFVDDDATFRKVLARELTAFGYTVRACADGQAALDALDELVPDVALVDLRMPGMSGDELLRALRARDSELPVVLLTGHGGVPEAVQAMREGAFDFVEKPAPLDALEQVLLRAVQHRRLRVENRRLRELVEGGAGAGEIVGDSRPARELRALVGKVAASEANVLVGGENGTGKELVARAIHHGGPRAERPFVVVHCGAIPDGLIESELFGHERGAFTGAERRRTGLMEAADGGTLFLDEIGELPLAVQPTLLRALQFGEFRPVGSERTRRVDVRVVAATNRDLLREVDEGRFREDLYYRLATLLVEVPALRERREDIPLLARTFIAALPPDAGPRALAPDALDLLIAHDWPGNVRELESAILRLATLCEGTTVGADEVRRLVLGQRRVRKLGGGGLPTLDLAELERLAVVEALRRHESNRRRAAAELGISIKTLYNKMQRYEIAPREHERPTNG